MAATFIATSSHIRKNVNWSAVRNWLNLYDRTHLDQIAIPYLDNCRIYFFLRVDASRGWNGYFRIYVETIEIEYQYFCWEGHRHSILWCLCRCRRLDLPQKWLCGNIHDILSIEKILIRHRWRISKKAVLPLWIPSLKKKKNIIRSISITIVFQMTATKFCALLCADLAKEILANKKK